jgi:16S rRNA (guanine527-N7)-methyltransferase
VLATIAMLEPAARALLERYCALLLRASADVNLTAARDERALQDHVADALAIAPYVSDPLVDVGSGGGLPGIPLAIATGFAVTLVESTGKKARFLERVVAELELPIRVVEMRAELAGRDETLRGHFGSATARAVGPLPTVLELTLPLLDIGGVAVLQRGVVDERERRAATDAARMLGGELAGEVPQDGAKQVLLFRKVSETPLRFPRRTGVPAKRPLCYPPSGSAP